MRIKQRDKKKNVTKKQRSQKSKNMRKKTLKEVKETKENYLLSSSTNVRHNNMRVENVENFMYEKGLHELKSNK